MSSIVVIGSVNIDLVARVDRAPQVGETVSATSFTTMEGGKGANQAVAAARLGATTELIARVGTDTFGVTLRQGLQRHGVSTSCVEEADGATGCAVITVLPDGANSIVVVPGANAALTPAEVQRHAATIASAGVLLAQLEVPLETVAWAAQFAVERSIPFVLDPAPAQTLPPNLLHTVTWLTPNETEAAFLLRESGILNAATTEERATALLALGPRNVILKLGADGVFMAGADVPATHVPAPCVNTVDTTAAGDAFNGGFAVALSEGQAPLDAARFGCAVAALSVTRHGAQASMPTLAEVNALLSVAEQ